MTFKAACVLLLSPTLWAMDAAPAAAQGPVAQTQQAIGPNPTFVDPRGLAGAGALVVTALLLVLYFYRRRPYIHYWIVGWALLAVSMFLAIPGYTREKAGFFAYGVSQFLGIVSSLVFVLSADAYRAHPRLRREYGYVVLPLLLWFALAPVALDPAAVFAPGHLLIAGGLAAAAFAHFALLRRHLMLGAAIIGAAFLALAAENVWIALTVPKPSDAAAARGLILGLVLYLVIALGMQLMSFEDMTEELRVTNRRLEQAQSELRQAVITDPLTGCRNRRFFDEIIGRELQRHRRYDVPLSLLFVDIDRFKAINDTLGHEAGDRVLQHVAAFLGRNIREADYVFRWGGDEFLVLLSCREAEARRRGLALQQAFAESPEAAALPPGIGLSIGTAELPTDSTDVMAHVKAADERMYVNKRRTRGAAQGTVAIRQG
jgi:diguanylate cyclase (GGDEF)-like protein